MKIIYWVKNLSHLHLHTWSCVEELSGEPVTYIITELENKIRKQQGWNKPDISNKDVILLNNRKWINRSVKIINQEKNAIHVFFGFWQERRWFPLILYCLLQGIKTAIIQEPYSKAAVGYFSEEDFITSNFKAKFRPLLYRFAASLVNIVSINKKRPCLLPISLIAKEQFEQAGFDKESLFPFGYFVQRIQSEKDNKKGDYLSLIYIASLIKRKGLDVAVSATNKLFVNYQKVTLDVYGPGDPGTFIPEHSNSVVYKGIIPTEHAQSVIADHDALLLPSRHDGWGLVVNEALLQGVPAIVSDRVGAKCLLEKSGAGMVFKSEDIEQLASILTQLVNDPQKLSDMRQAAEIVGSQILPQHGAQYLLDVFEYYFFGSGTKPNAIWTE